MLFKPFPIFGKGAGKPVYFGFSLRRFTRQQFADMTAIVGTSLDRALQDLAQRYNNLLPQDLQSTWVPNTYVWGYSPQRQLSTATQPMMLPWLYARNADATVVLDSTPQNEARLRGTFNPDIPWQTQSQTLADGNQFVWTNALYFDRPVRLQSVNVTMLGGMDILTVFNAYQNPFETGPTPPASEQPNSPINDLYIDVSVDNSWYGDRAQKLSTTEIQRRRLNAAQMAFTPIGLPGRPPTATFNPQYPPSTKGGTSYASPIGVSIDARNLNIPVPKNSVVRVSIVVPMYPESGGLQPDAGWNYDAAGGTYALPWTNQTYSATLHTLEAMQ